MFDTRYEMSLTKPTITKKVRIGSLVATPFSPKVKFGTYQYLVMTPDRIYIRITMAADIFDISVTSDLCQL